MHAITLAIIAISGFVIGYLFYARFIEKFLEINPNEKTPAHTKYDGIDYIPAKNWVILFGHHFSSIAGAAPIIGPVIAVSIWGWSPTIIWIILGSVLIGGLHDFASLTISVKSDAHSIADISKNVISPRAKLLFSLFVFLALILVVAVFAYLCANTFAADNRVIAPSLGLIPVAILVGILIYRVKFNQVISTLIGISGLVGLILLSTKLGNLIPHISINYWLIGLLIYAYFASITPVDILLQPRDYLSAFLLFFGIIVGYLGIFITNPKINLPAYVGWSINNSYLWPMLFVIVACGAISGFHSLIASGTTAKQLPNQRYAKRIGYGSMILEGALAVLATIAVITSFGNFAEFKKTIADLGPVGAFGKGFGFITSSILGIYGGMIGLVILNAFILTTLDTATRITRYIFEELTGFKNRWFSTIVVVILSAILAWGGRWRTIWPTFGASNQLVATLSLFVITCWLLSRNQKYYISLIPGIFMLITTITALVIQTINYFNHHQFLLFTISSLLIILALYLCIEVANTLKKNLFVKQSS